MQKISQLVVLGHKTMDASGQGWGAHTGDQMVQCVRNNQLARLSSNAKELKAVQKAFVAFGLTLIGKHVQVFLNNITTMSYINKQGTRVAGLMSIAEEILGWVEVNLPSLSSVHLKGELNSLANALSRETLSQTEWCLNRVRTHRGETGGCPRLQPV